MHYFALRDYLFASSAEPSSARRVGSSSRPLPRGSAVDYDQVPSPKPVPRRSSAHLGRNPLPLRPSRLRQEVRDEEIGSGPTAESGEDIFTPIGVEESREFLEYPDRDDIPESDSPSPSLRGNVSFTALAQDEEDNIPEEEDQSPVSSRADKGKGRADARDSDEEDNEIEEDIAAGLQEIDNVYEDQEENEPGPSKKTMRRDKDLSSDSGASNKRPSNHPRKAQPKREKKPPRISMYGERL